MAVSKAGPMSQDGKVKAGGHGGLSIAQVASPARRLWIPHLHAREALFIRFRFDAAMSRSDATADVTALDGWCGQLPGSPTVNNPAAKSGYMFRGEVGEIGVAEFDMVTREYTIIGTERGCCPRPPISDDFTTADEDWQFSNLNGDALVPSISGGKLLVPVDTVHPFAQRCFALPQINLDWTITAEITWSNCATMIAASGKAFWGVDVPDHVIVNFFSFYMAPQSSGFWQVQGGDQFDTFAASTANGVTTKIVIAKAATAGVQYWDVDFYVNDSLELSITDGYYPYLAGIDPGGATRKRCSAAVQARGFAAVDFDCQFDDLSVTIS